MFELWISICFTLTSRTLVKKVLEYNQTKLYYWCIQETDLHIAAMEIFTQLFQNKVKILIPPPRLKLGGHKLDRSLKLNITPERERSSSTFLLILSELHWEFGGSMKGCFPSSMVTQGPLLKGDFPLSSSQTALWEPSTRLSTSGKAFPVAKWGRGY